MKKKAVSLKPAPGRKQPAEITAEYLESEAHCVADLPSEVSHHDLFQLGDDFYLVETLLFLDGKKCDENPFPLLPLQDFSPEATAMRKERITSTKTVTKLTPEGAMHWYILNVAPEVFRKDLAGNVPDKSRKPAEVTEGQTKGQVVLHFSLPPKIAQAVEHHCAALGISEGVYFTKLICDDGVKNPALQRIAR